ncbi:YggS family pyridoxal phosphate-dependent enzyme [bacterium]|nr:YggS family pyridoxal phosphate-dependent enzyme [bacterium]
MITENVKNIINELPRGVLLEAAAKTRTEEEIDQAIKAGVKIIGENYIQEAEAAVSVIQGRVPLHFIGHLQKNKVKKAVKIFDMIETLDSIGLAKEIDKRALAINKVMPVLIEINSGREPQKFGILPEEAESFIVSLKALKNIKILGLMTMGPFTDEEERARPYFKETSRLFKKFTNAEIPHIEMKYLSMGMTGTYRVAVEEGANIVRIGTKIFGPRG